MKTLKSIFILLGKGFIISIGIALGLITIYATYQATTYTAGDNTLTAETGDSLTLAKWNELVSKTRGVFTDSNGKVGIGNPSPTESLDIVGAIRATNTGGGSSWTYSPQTNGSLQFYNSTVGTKVIFLENGNVGIGAISPATKLEVGGIVKSENTPKARASFNGEGSITMYDSYGIDSITRLSAGIYKINWSTPFINKNYIISGACNMRGTGGAFFGIGGNNKSGDAYEEIFTSSARIECRVGTTNKDSDLIYIMAYGSQ